MTATMDNRTEVFSEAREVLGEKICGLIDELLAKPRGETQLIKVLHFVQEERGYLSPEDLEAVAQLMQIPAARVSGVASFYHFFRLKPCGKHIINVCLGTACYVKGADRVANRLMEELNIDWGETSADGLFTLEVARCIGTCGLAPVVMVGDNVHGNLTPDAVPAMLKEYM